jgi:tRNA threonylcarbamoyladenosine biosynthesis protein TsaB
MILSEHVLEGRNIHSEKLLTLIDKTLADVRLGAGGLDGIAVSIGPGSFTGLRIGLSVAKGLVYALEIPLLAVSTLRALAQQVVDAGQPGLPAHLLATVDARRDEVYCQLFIVDRNVISPVWEPQDLTVAGLLAKLNGMKLVVTGDGAGKVIEALRSKHQKSAIDIQAIEGDLGGCRASSIARMGEEMLRQGSRSDPIMLEPTYLKEFFLTAAVTRPV